MSATAPAVSPAPRHRRHDRTPDAHAFPTRPYDLVKEFVLALVGVLVLTIGLAWVFSSPDGRPITMSDWAAAAPNDVVATAAGELAGTTTSAEYGPPYNANGDGQQLGPLELQKWAGVRLPVDSANDLVIQPLSGVHGDADLTSALVTWTSATADQRSTWAAAYADALTAAPDSDPAKVPAGDYGPVPTLASSFLAVAQSGGLEGILTS